MRFSLVAIGAVAMMASGVQAAITWNGGTGDWNHSTNWTPQQVPQASDEVIVNGGSITYWSGVSGGFTIRDGGSRTFNGGTLTQSGNHYADIGYSSSGGTGGGVLTINNGAVVDLNGSGSLRVGNAAGGQAGVVNVNAGGVFDLGGSSWLQLFETATFNSAGTTTGIGSVDLQGGIINVTGGEFTVNSVNFEPAGAKGNKINISGGTFSVNSVSAMQLGWGDRYFNFTAGSTGTLVFPAYDVATVTGYVGSGYIRLDSVASPDSFIVSAFGANGAQVSLVPEPTVGAMIALGLGALGVRRRTRV